MKKNSLLHAFAAYLAEKRRLLLCQALATGIFALVFFLYHLPLEAVFYAFLLAAALFLLFGLFSFLQYFRRRENLRTQQGKIMVCLGELPTPGGPLEKQYQELIVALQEEKTRLISQQDSRYADMVDYYTMWAHQIKTPISAMHLLLQTEKSGALSAQQRGVVMESGRLQGSLEQELFKIEQYVEMVLQYLRLESMSSDLMLRSYDLTELVRQAVKKYAPVFIHQKISLHLEDLDCSVLTDEKWLVFVLEQLLSNALKYTPKGSISIYMDAAAEKTLVIADTGIGIREEDLPRIFEKGFTGYNGRMDKRSTGIGLYLCKQILTRLSHRIHITSQIGKGTKVFIDLSQVSLEVE